MGFLFGGSRRRASRRPGLMGMLLGGNRYYQPPVRNQGLFGGLFGGNNYYQPRRSFRRNGLLGILAAGALGYAANRFFNGNNQGSQVGPFDQGGGLGSSDWGGTPTDNGGGSFDQGSDGQSW